MKKLFKSTLAVMLILTLLSSFSFCFAVELNQEAIAKHYGQYKNYVLLGDSAASGYRDIVTDRDQEFNSANYESTFYRVPGCYGDIITKSIIAEDTMIHFAGPSFRTVEIRYMLEDDYAEEVRDDPYLFYWGNVHVHGYAGSEEFRAKYKKAVSEADLITLGVGGNDWGAYLTWVMMETLRAEGDYDAIEDIALELSKGAVVDLEFVGRILDVLSRNANAIAKIAQILPSALKEGLSKFYANWDVMIQDIYDYNPDVTLMVVGMSDTEVKGHYYSYDGVPGEKIKDGSSDGDSMGAQLSRTITDFILKFGNTPMIEGAKKFGYKYIDTTGTTYVLTHPDAAGHMFIANKIIEALPDPDVFNKYADVTPGHKYYKQIEHVLVNGIMSPATETEFVTDAAFTEADLSKAIAAISNKEAAEGSDSGVSRGKIALALLGADSDATFMQKLKVLKFAINLLFVDGKLDLFTEITRVEAASIFYDYANI